MSTVKKLSKIIASETKGNDELKKQLKFLENARSSGIIDKPRYKLRSSPQLAYSSPTEK